MLAGIFSADSNFTDRTFRLLYIALATMTNLNRSDDNDLLVALRHPLRRAILREMAGEEAISPREIANALRQPLSNVSYHVRVLADCAAVSLVSTKPVRGSMQHFYRTAIEAPWARQVLGLGEKDEGPAGESPPGPET
jgi:DNA-binding transcriptional ArsR family regulator